MATLFEKIAIDWKDCPFVEINPRKVSGAPILKGSRMPADGIVENYLGGSPIDEIADNFEIAEADVRNLLLYASKQIQLSGFEGLVRQQCAPKVAPFAKGARGQNGP